MTLIDTPWRRRTPWPLVALLCLLPAIQTYVAVYLEFHPLVSYPLLKAAILAAPIVVWAVSGRLGRQLLRDIGFKRTNCLRGLASGSVLAAVILTGFYLAIKPAIDPAPLAAKARSLGILDHYWAMALFMSFWNSLVEEYYWRAFLLDQFRSYTAKRAWLCGLGGAFFGLHHVFATMGEFRPALVATITLGTMLAGAVWSWQRTRGHSILDCYVSHILADLAVFWAGWEMIRNFR